MIKPPDINESGRVLATLDDWRAITFVLCFVIVFLLARDTLKDRRVDAALRSVADALQKQARAAWAQRLDIANMLGRGAVQRVLDQAEDEAE